MSVTQIPRKPNKKMDVGVRRLLTSVILFILIIVVVALIVHFYPLAKAHRAEQQLQQQTGQSAAAGSTAIKEIRVEGNDHLPADTIVAASGLQVGQNFMTVSKTAAESNILSLCPYIKSVKVTTPTADVFVITVVEKTAVAAVYDSGRWVLLGEDLTAIGYREMTSDVPERILYVRGADTTGNKLGEAALEQRSAGILERLLHELNSQQVTGICEIDMTSLTHLSMVWNHQLRVELGDDSNLAYEVRVFASTLPKVLGDYGKHAKGIMDLSSYSDDNKENNQVIFTPTDRIQDHFTPPTESTESTESTGDGEEETAGETEEY